MQIHIYNNPEETTNALAEWITSNITNTLIVKDQFTIALSGGETPKKLYQTLATEPYLSKINWNKLHVFWGDERFVPFDDINNNAKMAYNSLLIHTSIPKEQIHKICTNILPDESTKQYSDILHQYFDNRQTTFDLVLLGMGDDGHTLSLFPGYEISHDDNLWVTATNSKEKGIRITLMPSIVNRSSAVIFLVTGEKKAKILQHILHDTNKINYPAQLINPLNKELHWFVDKGAAKYLMPEQIA